MMRSLSRSCLCAAALAACLAVACAGKRPALAKGPPAAAAQSWDAFVAEFIERYLALHPSYAVALGRHEYDGQLSDFSADAIEREVAWLERSRATALAFLQPGLSAVQAFERAYVLGQIEADLFWLRDMRVPFKNPAFYIDGLDPNTYVTVPYAPGEQRLRAFIAYARAVPNALAQLRANLRLPLPKTFIDFAVAGFRGYADFFRNDVPQAFADVHDEPLQAELKRVLEPAAQRMSELGDLFAAETRYADANYVLGAERFALMLRVTEGVATPLGELAQLGQADLDRNLTALDAACRAYLPDGSVRACVDKQQADKPQGGVVEGAREQLAALQRFIIEHEIVSIPGDEVARVAQAPAYRRQNFAYIDIPGPYERNLPSVYYIAPPDPAWSKADQDAYVPGKADLLFTSVHEVWPGHFLQSLHSKRSRWRFGQLFQSYAFDEGWAHYVEELMIEEGLARAAPELVVGQLLNALLRNVRFVCAIGLHTQGMTVAACEQLFKDKAFQDAGNARQQAARGTYDPGYLNYTLGKLMIQKLRKDWEAENPGHKRGEFHDALLSFGGPPIPLLRPMLLKQAGGSLF